MTPAFSKALNSESPLFVGGSLGGFAALYFSNFHKGSIAIVANVRVMATGTLPRMRTQTRAY